MTRCVNTNVDEILGIERNQKRRNIEPNRIEKSQKRFIFCWDGFATLLSRSWRNKCRILDIMNISSKPLYEVHDICTLGISLW